MAAPAHRPRVSETPGGAVRLFERNFLPGDTQIAFRTAVLRAAGGYDPAIVGPESFDVLLRAIRRGARVAFGDEAGYRMHAYPGSVSRQIDRQAHALALVLRKHAYDDVRRLYRIAGYDLRIANWALVSLALFRRDPKAALHFLDEASPDSSDRDDVIEPDAFMAASRELAARLSPRHDSAVTRRPES